MPVSIGTTFWKCRECGNSSQIDGTELAQIGVPICDKCETKLEPQDAPISTALLIRGEFIGVVVRPQEINRDEFQKRIVNLWKQWDVSDSDESFANWAEKHHGILFLASDYIINPIIR